MRRLLGPVGGPIAFFLVAAGVFAGLGWVTYAALGVERAQREAAARAELGYDLHRALSRLDIRMLSTLWGEDNRPYYDYVPPDPAATPLLVAKLPDWMKLHFQLDAAGGWYSPQVLDDAAVAERVRRAWGEVPVQNLNGTRTAARDELRQKFPPEAACGVFAARDLATASDPLPFAAPFIANDANAVSQFDTQQQIPSQPAPNPPWNLAQPVQPASGSPPGAGDENCATVRVFGIDLCWFLELRAASQLAENNLRYEWQQLRKSGDAQQSQLGPDPRLLNNVTRGGGRAGDGRNDFAKRAQTLGQGYQEAKNASERFSQNTIDPRNYGNYAGPVVNPPAPGDRTGSSTQPAGQPAQGGGFPGGPVSGTGGSYPPPVPAPGPGGFGGGTGGGGFGPPQKDGKDLKEKSDKDVLLDKLTAADDRALGGLAAAVGRSLRAEREKGRVGKPAGATDPAAPTTPPATSTTTLPPVVLPPAEPPAAVPPPAAPVAAPPAAIHLGSIRPQWITAPDGTPVLVLVRTARFNDKTVYQGIVIDWPKLQAELKSVVEDLFPDAALVPVRDADEAAAERAMTTLPVQLEPGPDRPLEPAGWTPLRIGLVLAWAAAIVAFVAVGLSGWSLIDLAERRIRFVSAVTHELRTPLTSLRLYLDLLLSGMIQDEAKRREYLNTLAVESDRLHRLIDNVLDFARLEKRKKNGDVRPVPVGDLMDHFRATWTDRAAQDGKELVVISTLPPDREVTTDPAMVQQIVGNLIDNARKYTRDAADRRIWVWAKPGASGGVILEVEDRGPGVPPGERKTIFKPFRRGEHADSTAGGAGLGLALAKSWAEVLGATLTYRPADGGVGACFRLELPGK